MDFQTFREGGREGRFVKMSGWLRVATHYSISLEMVEARHSATTLGRVSAASSSVAAVWRRSRKRTGGSPAGTSSGGTTSAAARLCPDGCTTTLGVATWDGRPSGSGTKRASL